MQQITRFNEDYRFLSNFWYKEVAFGGMLYKTNEHAFQAAKTLSEKDRQHIRLSNTPGDAKHLGRVITLRPDWEFIKAHVMLNLSRQKFGTDRWLRDQLVATGDAELIEGNTWGDKYWGVCDGEGQNMLGKILMCVREELK